MFRFHEQPDANLVLNILDRECRSAVQGIELPVLLFKWTLRGQPEAALHPAVQRLCHEGLLRPLGAWLRLTAAGYMRLTSPALERLPPDQAAGPAANEGPLTEYLLRGRILALFRAAGARAGERVAAAELARFWQVSQSRAADLRHGLDLVMRDGQVKRGRFSQTLFRLEAEGQAYLQGPQAPDWLAEYSPRVDPQNLTQPGMPAMSLCVLVAHQFRGQKNLPIAAAELDYHLEQTGLPPYLRAHALELMHRLGYAEADDGVLGLSLTEAADEPLRLGQSDIVQWAIKSDLKRLAGAGHD